MNSIKPTYLFPELVAHPPSNDNPVSQSLEEHLQGTNEYALSFCQSETDKALVSPIALGHDIAKTTTWVKEHLCPSCWSKNKDLNRCKGCGLKNPTGKDSRQIYHSPYGVLYMLLNSVTSEGKKIFDINRLRTEEWVYYNIVGGHHGGLMDTDTIQQRVLEMMSDPNTPNILKEIDSFVKSTNISTSPTIKFPYNRDDTFFDFFIKIKEVFSILCDADSLDTEGHSSPSKKDFRKPPKIEWTNLLQCLDEYYLTLSLDENGKQKKSKWKQKKLNKLRNELRVYSDKIASAFSRGYFSMEFPTGFGKTLASISFALNHAINIEKRGERPIKRIIYVLPFLTITAQTTNVLKEVFGDDINILEHHTGAEYALNGDDRKSEYEQATSDKDKRKILATENWDYPIIVTTDVQFFESVMSANRGSSRKIHNIADSIVILDEIQVISNSLWAPTIEILKSLNKVLNTSILFTSATMPAFSWENQKLKFDGVTSLVEDKQTLYRNSVRVKYHVLNNLKPLTINELSTRIFKEKGSTLLVLNTRRTAFGAYRELCKLNSNNKWDKIIYLNTVLNSKHRMNLINSIKKILKDDKLKILVVSTQLIEAGVDLDFYNVFRKIAPLESLIQSSGRCNREWKYPYGNVYIFDIIDTFKCDPWSDSYIERIAIVVNLLRRTNFLKYFSPFDLGKLHKSDIYEEYHKKCFSIMSSDKNKVLTSIKACNFKTASNNYKIIDSETSGVVVPYGDLTLDEYEYYRNKETITRADLRRLQPYMVSLFEGDLKKVEGIQIVRTVGNLLMLSKNHLNCYSEETGLSNLIFN